MFIGTFSFLRHALFWGAEGSNFDLITFRHSVWGLII